MPTGYFVTGMPWSRACSIDNVIQSVVSGSSARDRLRAYKLTIWRPRALTRAWQAHKDWDQVWPKQQFALHCRPTKTAWKTRQGQHPIVARHVMAAMRPKRRHAAGRLCFSWFGKNGENFCPFTKRLQLFSVPSCLHSNKSSQTCSLCCRSCCHQNSQVPSLTLPYWNLLIGWKWVNKIQCKVLSHIQNSNALHISTHFSASAAI